MAHRTKATIFELTDSSDVTLPVAALVRVQPRDASAVASRLASQFVGTNSREFAELGVRAELVHTGFEPRVHLRSSHAIGAVALTSPSSGKPDLGLVVRPRFEWPSLGKVLGESGMSVLPRLLPLAQLPYSERRIPRWVLSTVVLARLATLIRTLRPKFRIAEAQLPYPKGAVDWGRWSTVSLANARPLEFLCRFPDLGRDEEIVAFIHHVLLLQRATLQEQKSAGGVVSQLLQLCDQLLVAVANVPALAVGPGVVDRWMRRPLAPNAFRDGLTAALWTIEDRGLAGTAELAGLPWRLDMEVLFEAWIGSHLRRWSAVRGFQFRSDQRGETQVPIQWEPPYRGSQKSLRPDFRLQRAGVTVVFDAKYKGHWDDLNASTWGALEEDIQTAHRADLLQVLAYASTCDDDKVVCALVYPCHRTTWDALTARGQAVNRATVARGQQQVDLVLTAVPLDATETEVTTTLDQSIWATAR